MREEGGTPAIVEAVRAGVVVQLKEAAAAGGFIGEREDALMQRVRRWRADDARLAENFVLLGNSQGGAADRFMKFALLQSICFLNSDLVRICTSNSPISTKCYLGVRTGGQSGQQQYALHNFKVAHP